ncbi:MAG: HAD-IIIC family phosphatase [Actinobacteria bacterium]|nr:HAD-IIIC family phosphatase [Actinomycetota bacterium]MSV93928.1 HAD-IIIC family phosphatase [Actinomycetota bacterium]MSW60569.1 HAD-IIIC family phosphatase [Actinomycetota bacterium]MSY45333.1 HAD-IIIC family phosphatase [Actinomycetota bacterium]
MKTPTYHSLWLISTSSKELVLIHVLSNVNLAPLVPRITGHEVTLGDYGDVLRTLTDPNTDFVAEVLMVLLDGDELMDSGDLSAEIPTAIDNFAKSHPEMMVITSTICPSPSTSSTYEISQTKDGRSAQGRAYESAIVEVATVNTNVIIFDVKLVFDKYGREKLTSSTFWYAGRIPYTTLWFEECGRHVAGLLDAYAGRTRKVLVCDLDGTLWGGILGEDGPSGIALGEDGVGKCYRDLQRQIKTLLENGVLLALISKNNRTEVDDVFTGHPMMILQPEDFVATRVGWGDKASSLMAIAEDLSLGLDSFVFLDDNPVERAMISENLPTVAVPDFPTRPELLLKWFVDEVAFPYFPRVRVLDSDRNKTAQYQARNERISEAESVVDLDAFIERLEIQLDIRTDDEFSVERAAQMTQKTNQFNLTTKRCTPDQIKAWMDSNDHAVFTLAYQDKFGDEGIVGLAVIALSTADIPVFLLSCRIIGRKVERSLLRCIEEFAVQNDLTEIKCLFVPTEKNSVSAEFLNESGWVIERAEVVGGISYRKDLS